MITWWLMFAFLVLTKHYYFALLIAVFDVILAYIFSGHVEQ